MSSEKTAGLALDREMRLSALRTVMFHHVLAQRVGVNITDFNCLSVLALDGPLTAGQLADRVGLTRGGAVTAAIDRLERAGWAVRRRDERDRRRVIVEVTERAIERIGPMFADYGAAWDAYLATLTPDQIDFLTGFFAASNELTLRETLAQQDQARLEARLEARPAGAQAARGG